MVIVPFAPTTALKFTAYLLSTSIMGAPGIVVQPITEVAVKQAEKPDSLTGLRGLGRGGEPSGVTAKSSKATGKSSQRDLVDRPHFTPEERQTSQPVSTSRRSAQELTAPLPVAGDENISASAAPTDRHVGRSPSSQGSYKPQTHREPASQHSSHGGGQSVSHEGSHGSHSGGGGGHSGGGGSSRVLEDSDEFKKLANFNDKVSQGHAPYADGQHPNNNPLKIVRGMKDSPSESGKELHSEGQKGVRQTGRNLSSADENSVSIIPSTGISSRISPVKREDANIGSRTGVGSMEADSYPIERATGIEAVSVDSSRKDVVSPKGASSKTSAKHVTFSAKVSEKKSKDSSYKSLGGAKQTKDMPASISASAVSHSVKQFPLNLSSKKTSQATKPLLQKISKMEDTSSSSSKNESFKGREEDTTSAVFKRGGDTIIDIEISPELRQAADLLGFDLYINYSNIDQALIAAREAQQKLTTPYQGVVEKLIEEKERELKRELLDDEFGELLEAHKLQIECANKAIIELDNALEIIKIYFDKKFKRGPAKIKKAEGNNPAEAMMNLFSGEEKLTAEEIHSEITVLKPKFNELEFELQYAMRDPEQISLFGRELSVVRKDMNVLSEEMEDLKQRYRKQLRKEQEKAREAKASSSPKYAEQQKEHSRRVREAKEKLESQYPTVLRFFELLQPKDKLNFMHAKMILLYERASKKFALEQDSKIGYGGYKYVDINLVEFLNELAPEMADNLFKTISARREEDRFNAIKNPSVFVNELGYEFPDEKKHEFSEYQKRQFALQRQKDYEEYKLRKRAIDINDKENLETSGFEKKSSTRGQLDTTKFGMFEKAEKKKLKRKPLSDKQNDEIGW